MDLHALQAEFGRLRARQAALHGRSISPFDGRIGEVMFRAASLALADGATADALVRLRVVSAPTGSGKSCASAALAAAGVLTDPGFSAAFVVETMRQADAVYELIAELLPPERQGDVAVWTTAHDERTKPEKAREELGRVPARCFRREQLRETRVVVVTHRKWLDEMARGQDAGVRAWRGERRSLVFLDEEPKLARLVELSPAEVDRLGQSVEKVSPDHPWLPVLNRMVAEMTRVFAEVRGGTYAPVELVTAEDAGTLADPTLTQEVNRTIAQGFAPGSGREARLDDVTAVLDFARAARSGFVFLNGQAPRRFVAYQLQFTPSPGFVLLDATADISGMRFLLPGMEPVAVPQVDYCALRIGHLGTPKEFRKRIDDVTGKAVSARAYAGWITGTVLANTAPGERVLVVTHKKLFDHEYLTPAPNPEDPADWAGRQVSTLHWGSGIGSNRFKDCATVFMFGEFFIPRAQVVGTVLAHRGQRFADAPDLADAKGRELRGRYLDVYEGHLLRWTKQLATRGAARNIDAEGRCTPMRLFTSMALDRLARFREAMFPGSAEITIVSGPGSTPGKPARAVSPPAPRDGKPGELLTGLLTSGEPGAVIWSDEAARLTGIAGRNLRAELNRKKVAPIAAEFGWVLRTAAELGQQGKRLALVREAGPTVAPRGDTLRPAA